MCLFYLYTKEKSALESVYKLIPNLFKSTTNKIIICFLNKFSCFSNTKYHSEKYFEKLRATRESALTTFGLFFKSSIQVFIPRISLRPSCPVTIIY